MELLQYSDKEFLDRVYRKSKSENSRDLANTALNQFDVFCIVEYKVGFVQCILKIKQGELDAYRVLDSFVKFMDDCKIAATSQHPYMSHVRGFLVYQDIDINPYKFSMRVSMPKKLVKEDATPSLENVARILQVLPLEVKLLCMLVMSSLRRPNELLKLRLRDYNMDTVPTTVRIPASISKNRKDGTTFITREVTDMLADFVRSKHLKPDDYVFTNHATAKNGLNELENSFRNAMKRLPDLNEKIEGLKQNRYTWHIYSFKDFGYTRIDKKLGKNFSDGMKGDKGASEYHRMPLEEKMESYLTVEPDLTIFNADAVRKELDGRFKNQSKEIEALKARMEQYETELANRVKNDMACEMASDGLYEDSHYFLERVDVKDPNTRKWLIARKDDLDYTKNDDSDD